MSLSETIFNDGAFNVEQFLSYMESPDYHQRPIDMLILNALMDLPDLAEGYLITPTGRLLSVFSDDRSKADLLRWAAERARMLSGLPRKYPEMSVEYLMTGDPEA